MITTSTARTIFKSQDIQSTSYVYTANASTGADDGWISGKNEFNYVQVYLGTINATSLTIRVEGRTIDSAGENRAASLHVESYTAKHSMDKVITISEKFNQIRVGAKIDATATPNNLHVRVIQTDRR